VGFSLLNFNFSGRNIEDVGDAGRRVGEGDIIFFRVHRRSFRMQHSSVGSSISRKGVA
jgi:hypothetical protein